MNRNTLKLLLAFLALAVVYVWQFTDWFTKQHIQITVMSRPGVGTAEPGGATPIVFRLDGEYVLDKVRVVSLTSVATNRSPLEVWGLDRKGKVAPAGAVRGFAYGAHLDGMAVHGSDGEPLIPGYPYRLEVAAGKVVGSVDFVPRAIGE